MACAAPQTISRAGAAPSLPPAQAAEPAEAVSACRQFLQRTTLRALMRPQQEIVTLMHSQTIGEALEVGRMPCLHSTAQSAVLSRAVVYPPCILCPCPQAGGVSASRILGRTCWAVSPVQVLAKANILSAPLVVENGLEDSGSPSFRESGSFGQAVIGWIDVADLVAALLSRECRSATMMCHHATLRLCAVCLTCLNTIKAFRPRSDVL